MARRSTKEKKTMSVFKQIREKANINQDEFANILGVTPVTVSRWETGKHMPMLTLKQMKILGYLLRGMGLQLSDLPDDPFAPIDKLELNSKEITT